ncbi:helix-turn-helix domain-containing protein [Methylobacterium mesophilicum]|uniref:helix-turn-helix domain-containing protein n=1 Tax=Methylobacterium mesophilicum TaxID=39956 RepID=UPI002F3480FA
MQTFFSTDDVHPGAAFRRWREMVCERVALAALQTDDAGHFRGKLEVTDIGGVPISRLAHTSLRTEATADMVRRNGRHNRVCAILRLSGNGSFQQGDQEARTRPGDLVVLDARPAVCMTEASSSLVVDLPRERLENVLGPSRLFSGLTIGADLASTTLASSYLRDLVRVGDRLTPDAAARMASIGIDLIVASLAERLAQDVPRSTHGAVAVQRAKAYIEAHLGDAMLDPPRLAAAVGVSLRRLQELFHERGRHISDYIWERRLEVAARRLADPSCAHLSIGTLAYESGFASQAHFARRFKERHGLTPTEFRLASRQTTPDARPRGRPVRIPGPG